MLLMLEQAGLFADLKPQEESFGLLVQTKALWEIWCAGE